MTETMESETHTFRLDDDGKITVDCKTEPMVRQIGPDGETLIPATKLFANTGFLRNVFIATYAGDGEWNVDCNAGVQRWIGTQSGVAVSSALKKCGFDLNAIKYLMGLARKATHKRMARQF